MMAILLVGFLMIVLSVWFTYAELQPYLEMIRSKCGNIKGITLIIAFIWHTVCNFGLLVPSLIDILCVVFLSTMLGFGGGLLGGVTGLFASNCISFIIYYHTHIKHGKRAKFAH